MLISRKVVRIGDVVCAVIVIVTCENLSDLGKEGTAESTANCIVTDFIDGQPKDFLITYASVFHAAL